MRARALFLGLLCFAATPASAEEEKPRVETPQVFRTVLDKRPRSVVIRFDDDLWLAYDATTGLLMKAWEGTVKLDGAVHTTVHGPQPTTDGAACVVRETGFPWNVHGTGMPALQRYLGYRITNGLVQLALRAVRR